METSHWSRSLQILSSDWWTPYYAITTHIKLSKIPQTFRCVVKDTYKDPLSSRAPLCTKVAHSKLVGNYRSKADVKPWIELELTEAVDVAGLEVWTFGHQDNKRFRNILFRAGLTRSPVGGPGSGDNLLTHNEFILKYTATAAAKEIVYIMFPKPVRLFNIFILISHRH